jgi:hypothetical protein
MTKPDFAVDPKDYAKLFEAIQRQNEPLHPDLAPYYEEDSFAMLRHPLIYQVPFFSGGQANYQYEVKKKLVEEALEKKNYKSFVWLHERPYRLEAFAQIEQLLDDKEYWSLLGQIWTDTENGWAHLAQWKKFFKSDRAHRNYLMDWDEQMALDSLADRVTIYRGCQKGLNENGISWTLKRDKAEWFATRFGKDGKVLEMRINKSRILALFTGRNEYEVVVL